VNSADESAEKEEQKEEVRFEFKEPIDKLL